MYKFLVYVSIGTLESDLLSQSNPCVTKWTLVYLLRLYSTQKLPGPTACLKLPCLKKYRKEKNSMTGLELAAI